MHIIHEYALYADRIAARHESDDIRFIRKRAATIRVNTPAGRGSAAP